MLSKVKYMAKIRHDMPVVEVKEMSQAQFIRLEFPDKAGHVDIKENIFRDSGGLNATGVTVKGSKLLHLEELTLSLCRLSFKEDK